MEKIYMQDSEQQESQSQRQSKMFRFSVVLSFFVAIFAIVSLIAAGFNQISYAANAGTEFTFYEATETSTSSPIMISASGSSGPTFSVPVYVAGDRIYTSSESIPIFCVEHYTDILDEASYRKASDVEDRGLLYILNQSKTLGGAGIVKNYSNDSAISGLNAEQLKMTEIYATQVAIWVYLYERYYLTDPTTYAVHSLAYAGENQSTAETNYNVIKSANTLSVTNYSVLSQDIGIGDTFYNTYIAPVVSAARAFTGVKTLTISKANNTISKVGDDTYYQSAIMTVNADPDDDLISYDVSTYGIESAIIVDENGETKNSGFAPGEKFYVRVPVKDVSEQTGKVGVEVQGKFRNYLNGSYYANASSCNGAACQLVVTVTGSENYEYAYLDIDFVGTPSTGMSKAQTIFFIGLVVLLCGVGIIYANSKSSDIES